MDTTFPAPPTLSPTPPTLPQRWRATALLTPYRNEQVEAAEVLYDWSARAMRITSYGVEAGALDVLYVEDQFYLLVPAGAREQKRYGPFPSPVPVPAPDWLHPRSLVQVGSGAVMGTGCDWWVGYSPNANGYETPPPPNAPVPQVCNWIWTRKDTGLPFRLFFTNADNPYGLPGLGEFSFTVFTAFAAAEETGLAGLVAEVRAGAMAVEADLSGKIAAARGFAALRAAAAGLDESFLTAATGEAGRLIPGLEPAPADAPLPLWSDRLCITGYTYPTARSGSGATVMPMRVFYDWPKRRMLTRCSLSPAGFDGVPVEDLILNDAMTYIVQRNPDGSHACLGTKPVGLPRPTWAQQDNGVRKAVIRDNPVLGPGETLHVSALPQPDGTGRWFWVWYTAENDGRLFMETPQLGDVGLVLTEYDRFDHDPPPFPDADFVVPQDCLIRKEG